VTCPCGNQWVPQYIVAFPEDETSQQRYSFRPFKSIYRQCSADDSLTTTSRDVQAHLMLFFGLSVDLYLAPEINLLLSSMKACVDEDTLSKPWSRLGNCSMIELVRSYVGDPTETEPIRQFTHKRSRSCGTQREERWSATDTLPATPFRNRTPNLLFDPEEMLAAARISGVSFLTGQSPSYNTSSPQLTPRTSRTHQSGPMDLKTPSSVFSVKSLSRPPMKKKIAFRSKRRAPRRTVFKLSQYNSPRKHPIIDIYCDLSKRHGPSCWDEAELIGQIQKLDSELRRHESPTYPPSPLLEVFTLSPDCDETACPEPGDVVRDLFSESLCSFYSAPQSKLDLRYASECSKFDAEDEDDEVLWTPVAPALPDIFPDRSPPIKLK